MSPSTDTFEPAEAVKTAAKQKKDRQARKYGFACKSLHLSTGFDLQYSRRQLQETKDEMRRSHSEL